MNNSTYIHVYSKEMYPPRFSVFILLVNSSKISLLVREFRILQSCFMNYFNVYIFRCLIIKKKLYQCCSFYLMN